MQFNLRLLCFRKVIKQEIPAVRRKFLEALIQTFAGKARLLGSFRGYCHIVNIQMRPLFAQRLAEDVSGDAIAVSDFVFDLLFGTLQDYAVDGLVRQFIRKAALALGKESAQAKPQALVLLTRPVPVGTEPIEKPLESFSRYFLFHFGCRSFS